MKNTIAEALRKALEAEDIKDITIQVTTPTDQAHGDYTSNVAMVAFGKNKELGIKNNGYKTPMELAEVLKKHLEKSLIHNSKFIILKKIEIIKPGFLNFWLDQEFIITQLNQHFTFQGQALEVQKQKIIVEYSSPNIAKPFTIGHLRSTIIGDAIANILEAVGYEVYRDNHIGDWGTQFGKQIYAIKAWGNEDRIEKAENPVKELVVLYVKFHEEAEKDLSLEDKAREWFKKLEDGDIEAKRLWQKCIDWSWKEFQKIYDELGVPSHGTFENNGHGYGESFFEDKMLFPLNELKKKKLLTDSQGAQLVMYQEEKLPPLMIIKKDGATLYATRDLATDKFRLEKYGKDIKIINEVGIEQELYFRQLYELENMLGWFDPGQRVHLKHGHFRFKEQKMSTRKGNVIWLEDVIEEAKKRAWALSNVNMEFGKTDVVSKSQKTSESAKKNLPTAGTTINNASIIAIGALKWNDLKHGTQMDVVFDWDDLLNMQGNSGPYMQYTYVRTQSILRKMQTANIQKYQSTADSLLTTVDRRPLTVDNKPVLNPFHDDLNDEEVILLRTLFQFQEVVAQAAEDLAPSHVATYLFDLAQKFNNFYQKHKILESEQKVFRIGLVTVVGETIKQGLDLLGIPVPERM